MSALDELRSRGITVKVADGRLLFQPATAEARDLVRKHARQLLVELRAGDAAKAALEMAGAGPAPAVAESSPSPTPAASSCRSSSAPSSARPEPSSPFPSSPAPPADPSRTTIFARAAAAGQIASPAAILAEIEGRSAVPDEPEPTPLARVPVTPVEERELRREIDELARALGLKLLPDMMAAEFLHGERDWLRGLLDRRATDVPDMTTLGSATCWSCGAPGPVLVTSRGPSGTVATCGRCWGEMRSLGEKAHVTTKVKRPPKESAGYTLFERAVDRHAAEHAREHHPGTRDPGEEG